MGKYYGRTTYDLDKELRKPLDRQVTIYSYKNYSQEFLRGLIPK
jgi:hypothetical protein